MKYIIEIPDDVQYVLLNGQSDHKCYTAVCPVAELEILNSDYINEHFGELQEEAYQRGHDDGYEAGCATAFKPVSDAEYQRGLEDAWEAAKKIFGYEIDGAIPIADIGNVFGYEPCKAFCTADILRDFTVQEAITKLKAYDDGKHSDSIEVGDEVETKDGKRFVVTTFGSSFDGDIAVGVCADGLGLGVDLKELRKTGKHYDIASILEAMRE